MYVGPALAKNIKKPEGSLFNIMNEQLKGSFYIEPVTTQEIINIVNKKSSKTLID